MRCWCSKPQSVTFQSLDSDSLLITTFTLAPRPTCLRQFLDHLISPLLPPPISSGCRRSTSQLHPLPTSFPGTDRRLPGRHPHPPTQPAFAARSAPCTACLHPPLAFTQVHVDPWGFACRRSLRASMSCLPPRVMFRFPSSSGTCFLWMSF